MNNKIAEAAESILGFSREEIGAGGTHAWCAHAVSIVLKKCGISMWDLSCNSMKAKMSSSDEWDEPESYPERGDVIFFDWDGTADPEYKTRPLDHIGIVVAFSYPTITYINGNGNSSRYVTRQTINVNSKSVAYWLRYIGKGSSTPESTPTAEEPVKAETPAELIFDCIRTLKKGMTGKDVEALQAVLIAKGYSCGTYGSDGDFGTATEKAVINYQTERKLEADGVVGEKTFRDLWRA